ncbi:MAG TPA: hypothetical protein VKV95_19960 [Terriglobia bacterium]|nr:hypothetical protein [Terriglobia bacterium]
MSEQGLSSQRTLVDYGGAWWNQASSIVDDFTGRQVWSEPVDWYQLGEGFLGVAADDSSFKLRFRQIFAECSTPPPNAGQGPVVKIMVRSLDQPSLALINIEDPEPLDSIQFALSLFANRGFVEVPSPVAGWRLLAGPGKRTEPLMAVQGNLAIADRNQPWQAMVANCVVNRVLRLQPNHLFFHAASVAIHGSGILLSGPKGSGKTTTSIALASRGHSFLGDEVAAVRTNSNELIPFRRSVAIKPGPCAQIVDERLKEGMYTTELLPDGTARVQIALGTLFPDSIAQPSPLRSIFFLRGFAARARAEQFSPKINHVQLLAPLGGTLWGVSPSQRMMRFLSLLSKIRCYFLDVGAPEETASLVEDTMEA